MPTARLTAQRIRSGTQAVVDVTTAYAVTARTVQSDQDIIPWALAASLTTAPRRARASVMADESAYEDGTYRFQWGVSIMTHLMYKVWCDDFLPSGAARANVTVMTYDEYDVAVYLQCKIIRPTSLNRVIGGYRDVIWEFAGGVIIT